MSILGKSWKITERKDNDLVKHLLLARDIPESEQASFLNPDYERGLHSPDLLLDMNKAVGRVGRALKKNEKIVIYGDYDADGVCAAALLQDVFTQLGAKNISVYIPHRSEEGYGMNMEAVDQFIQDKVDLIITVDCGSGNIAEIRRAQGAGIDVIVTDHHQVLADNNPAYAFINPYRKGDKYPFKGLCGTAVAFKLASALIASRQNWEVSTPGKAKTGTVPALGYEKWLLDLVAIATVTDVMPLVGENRMLVKYGLLVLAQTKRPGLRALLEIAGVKYTTERSREKTNLNSHTLGFIIGPRLNAAGRMQHADIAFKLVIAKDMQTARKLAKQLDETNQERRGLVEEIMKEAEKEDLESQPLIFIGAKHWPIGVAGIVAGRLAQKYYKPAFVYEKMAEGKLVGSVRTPQYFSTIKMLESAGAHLEKFGGHEAAGGFTALLENEKKVFNALRNYALLRVKDLEAKELMPHITLDAELLVDEIDLDLHTELARLEPHGEANSRPVFLLRDVALTQLTPVGVNGSHLKCFIEAKNKRFKAIGFRLASYAQELREDQRADVAFHLARDDFNSHPQVSLEIIDVKIKDNKL